MKTNTVVKKPKISVYTHGGAVATAANPEQQLRRSLMSCLLWESEFYEDGEKIASRIEDEVKEVLTMKDGPQIVSDLAYELRTQGKLRHAPLFLTLALVRAGKKQTKVGKKCRSLVAETIDKVIQRPDELAEFLSMYWKPKKQPLSNQVKKGLASAFTKFNEYAISKYANREGAISLRDVLFLTHPKALDKTQQKLWDKLANKELTAPDTWERELSAGEGKKETFTRLLEENKLGALALLRNLRNMQQSGVDESLIRSGLENMKTERVLPFRFISAAKYAPKLEPDLEKAMYRSVADITKLAGKTILIVDCSGSMTARLSDKSELTRLESAAALAILVRELSENAVVYATAGDDYRWVHKTELIPARRGFALRDLLTYSNTSKRIGGGGIFLNQVIEYVKTQEKDADRIIVFTDEQDTDTKLNPGSARPFGTNNYLVNIASAKNGISYNKNWLHLDGFSESLLLWIDEYEKLERED